jgi:hypothetical protein
MRSAGISEALAIRKSPAATSGTMARDIAKHPVMQFRRLPARFFRRRLNAWLTFAAWHC